MGAGDRSGKAVCPGIDQLALPMRVIKTTREFADLIADIKPCLARRRIGPQVGAVDFEPELTRTLAAGQ